MSAVLDDPNDGRVSVEDTKLEGMDDFIIVEHSHAFMMRLELPIELTIRFLKTGSFIVMKQSERVRMVTSLGEIELELYPYATVGNPVAIPNTSRSHRNSDRQIMAILIF